MPDFKLTLTNADDPPQIGDGIMDRFGDDFDADRGDFRVVVESDGTINLYVLDVALGDIQTLVAQIYDEFNTVYISGSTMENGTWFPTEIEG